LPEPGKDNLCRETIQPSAVNWDRGNWETAVERLAQVPSGGSFRL
jgi:hypothetical protein